MVSGISCSQRAGTPGDPMKLLEAVTEDQAGWLSPDKSSRTIYLHCSPNSSSSRVSRTIYLHCSPNSSSSRVSMRACSRCAVRSAQAVNESYREEQGWIRLAL